MNVYWRKLRGVIGIGLLSAPLWAALFHLLTFILQFFLPPDSDVGTLRMMMIIAWVGLVSGLCFAVLLSLAENGKALRSLSLRRIALWGMLGAAVFPLLTERANQVFWTCPLGAIVAVVLVALARKAARREVRQPKGLRDIFFAFALTPVRDALNPRQVNVMLWLLMSVFLFTACGNDRTFDSTAWLQGDLRTRGRMCEDLIERKLLVGQTVTEAQRLLGPPNKEFPTVLAYSIDMGMPFKDPAHYGLQLQLDENRNVREVRIVD